jgi:putative membrane protein
MAGFLLRLLIAALGLAIASEVVPGMRIEGLPALFAAAFLLGLANAFVRPVVVLLTLPFTIVTLGLFVFVVNAAMLALVAAVLDGFTLSGFTAALLGSLIVSFTGWVASWYVGPSGRVEVIVARRRRTR